MAIPMAAAMSWGPTRPSTPISATPFPSGSSNGDQIYLNGVNIFNERPPFYNAAGQAGAAGNDDFITNLIGRVMSVGLQAKF